MISPAILFVLIMGVIGTFQTFTQAYIMTGGGPANATLFYLLYLYKNAFNWFEMGYASALAWVLVRDHPGADADHAAFIRALGVLRKPPPKRGGSDGYTDYCVVPVPRSIGSRRACATRFTTWLFIYGLLIVIGSVILLPLLWTLSSSLKPYGSGHQVPAAVHPRAFEWQNYPKV